jgi:hypothetical protein
MDGSNWICLGILGLIFFMGVVLSQGRLLIAIGAALESIWEDIASFFKK